MTKSLHVVIAGGSGMIGRALTAELFALGHNVTVLTRSPSTRVQRARPVVWNPEAGQLDLDALGEAKAGVDHGLVLRDRQGPGGGGGVAAEHIDAIGLELGEAGG